MAIITTRGTKTGRVTPEYCRKRACPSRMDFELNCLGRPEGNFEYEFQKEINYED